MLVLTRKTRQQIHIGDNITITILLVKGQTVRVGIEAPRNVRVLRAELPVFDDACDASVATTAAVAEVSPPTKIVTAAPRTPRSGGTRRGSADKTRTSPAGEGDASVRAATSLSPRPADGGTGLLAYRRRSRVASLTQSSLASTSLGLQPLFDRH